ncbi:hypothetical protein D3C86_1552430 [compost metagenome]
MARRPAATWLIRLPTAVEPVNETALTPGSATRAAPTRPSPWTRLSTPGARPASTKAFTIKEAVTGVCSAGFSTTGLPATRAGTSFQAGMAKGKFQGVMRPTTPSARRTV